MELQVLNVCEISEAYKAVYLLFCVIANMLEVSDLYLPRFGSLMLMFTKL